MSAFKCLRSATAALISRPVTLRAAVIPFYQTRLLSTSLIRRGEGQSASTSRLLYSGSTEHVMSHTDDQALSAKLNAELKYEREAAASSEPDFLQDLKNEGIWTVRPPCWATARFRAITKYSLDHAQVEDKAGNDEVALTRNFGNEQSVLQPLELPLSILIP